MRILVFGYGAIGVRALELLAANPDIELLGLVARVADGRSSTSWAPSASAFAQRHGLPILRPASVNEPAFVEQVRALEPAWLVLAQYDQILRPDLLAVPSLGTVNIHYGLLPRCRGVMPIPWGMIEDSRCGVTIHHVDPGIDTGAVISQAALEVVSGDTAFSLYQRATEEACALLELLIPALIAGAVEGTPQCEEEASHHRTGYPNERWIDWSISAATIDCLVRALTFPSYPSARSSRGGDEFEVLHPLIVAESSELCNPGRVIGVDDSVWIGTGLGRIGLQRVRTERGEMSASDWARSISLEVGATLDSVPWTPCHAPTAEART